MQQPDPIGTADTANQDNATTVEIDDWIATQLRAAFADVLNEPVPDRFLVLLEKLAKSEEP